MKALLFKKLLTMTIPPLLALGAAVPRLPATSYEFLNNATETYFTVMQYTLFNFIPIVKVSVFVSEQVSQVVPMVKKDNPSRKKKEATAQAEYIMTSAQRDPLIIKRIKFSLQQTVDASRILTAGDARASPLGLFRQHTVDASALPRTLFSFTVFLPRGDVPLH